MSKYPTIEEKPIISEGIVHIDTIKLEPILIIPPSAYGAFRVDDIEYRDIIAIEETGNFRTYKQFRPVGED